MPNDPKEVEAALNQQNQRAREYIQDLWGQAITARNDYAKFLEVIGGVSFTFAGAILALTSSAKIHVTLMLISTALLIASGIFALITRTKIFKTDFSEANAQLEKIVPILTDFEDKCFAVIGYFIQGLDAPQQAKDARSAAYKRVEDFFNNEKVTKHIKDLINTTNWAIALFIAAISFAFLAFIVPIVLESFQINNVFAGSGSIIVIEQAILSK
jgi:hypothetical protein